MDYEQLGRTGLNVGRLALGTINFGIVTNEADRFAMMDEAVDSGVSLFDGADVYGGPQPVVAPRRCVRNTTDAELDGTLLPRDGPLVDTP